MKAGKAKPYFASKERDFVLYRGDCRAVVPQLGEKRFDMVFADPPYFLSNGGFSVQAGRQVSVNKGAWDRSTGLAADRDFTCEWLRACRESMKDAATIWVCGTFHNVFTVATALAELDFRILNSIVWQKSNPPPNLSCRFFTHSTEFVVWARKSKRVPHYYNYDLMHRIAGGRQMTDVWRLPAIARWEKTCGKHPTQKPLSLLVRTVLASTRQGDEVLDPFSGSATTGIAANLCGRRYCGVEREGEFLAMSAERRKLLTQCRDEWLAKLPEARA